LNVELPAPVEMPKPLPIVNPIVFPEPLDMVLNKLKVHPLRIPRPVGIPKMEPVNTILTKRKTFIP